MMSVSLPTHVTGYFLPETIATVCLWTTTALGLIYAAVGGTCFFAIMNQAISDAARYGDRPTRLKAIHWALPIIVVLVIGSSATLYFVGLGHDAAEWESFCLAKSAIVIAEPEEGGKTGVEQAKLYVCRELFLNQTYMVPGAPLILVMLECVRFWTTRTFIAHSAAAQAPGTAATTTTVKAARLSSRSRRRTRRRSSYTDEDTLLMLSD
ncbi:hypothetical protein ACM66B_006852 [Microbotryomycetes sp. NB124-2]